MIEISLEEAMRCLQIFQEQQPENGYVFQCFNLGISALKTLMDMQLNGDYTPARSKVSRETLIEIANYDCCSDKDCSECKLYAGKKLWCISNRAKELLKKEEIEKWIITNYKN